MDTPIFVTPNDPNVKDNKFNDIFNSVDSLLHSNDELNRSKLLPSKAEATIQSKQEKQYYQMQAQLSQGLPSVGVQSGFDLNPLFGQYGANMLAGYSLRVTEEIKGKKTAINRKDLATHIREFMKEEDKDKYEIFSDDPISRGLEYGAYSLLWKSSYKKYTLIAPNEFERYLNSIYNLALNVTTEVFTRIMNEVYQIKGSSEDQIRKNKEKLGQEVFDDILFGYCLRIATLVLL
ncbi:MAG TPA: hypothetical protein VMR34_05515 [Candidatus Saccharimonadales bacterium]|nr:hypothetical protein [Candidatus Saccharimonadales bacterium]